VWHVGTLVATNSGFGAASGKTISSAALQAMKHLAHLPCKKSDISHFVREQLHFLAGKVDFLAAMAGMLTIGTLAMGHCCSHQPSSSCLL